MIYDVITVDGNRKSFNDEEYHYTHVREDGIAYLQFWQTAVKHVKVDPNVPTQSITSYEAIPLNSKRLVYRFPLTSILYWTEYGIQ